MMVLEGTERQEFLELMAYEIIEAYKKKTGGKMPSKRYMNNAMFLLANRLKESGEYDCQLPFWWDKDGVEIEWEQVSSKIRFEEST
jgi:hypothetical protein